MKWTYSLRKKKNLGKDFNGPQTLLHIEIYWEL